MRIQQPAGARGNFYDRNPVPKAFASAQSAVAPHGATTRFTYTVPSNKKAFVGSYSLNVVRITAAAPVAEYFAAIVVTPNGGAATNVAEVRMFKNGIGDDGRLSGPVGYLFTLDQIVASDTDLSTGGTVTFSETLQAHEYDV